MKSYPTESFSASAARVVSGVYLAKNRLGARERAKIAGDILAKKAVVVDLTATQLAKVCRVSLA